MEEPGRWAQWAVPSPVSDAEIGWAKERRRRKARMDQRTRERLPVLPVLTRTAAERKAATAARLQAAMAAPPGQIIEGTGGTLRRAVAPMANGRHVWAEDTATGKRRNLSYEEEEAFWAFAAIEVLRLTGIRCEELLELTHHGITEYRLPTTGELVPLLQIAPSKTDTERMLLVSPELADVLSAIISRLRSPGGTVPLTVSYDVRERVWNPPMPLLFQRSIGSENRAFTPSAIRKLLISALAATGLTDAAGDPLMFSPHDFRRIFVTDAIMSGLPPHIAQVICGHKNIGTTIGYKAVYPAEAIEAHRAFARRRATRPSEEYRTPTDEEWDAFLAHFEKRKVSVGTCARAFASPCVHEHACVRCSLLRPDPAQRGRLEEIRANLHDRIAEAEREGWLGEIEGLKVSLAGTEDKLAPDRHRPAAPGAGRPPRHARVPRHRRPLRPAGTGRNPVTTVNPRRLGDALRACARGIHPLEAGTGLLIDCGSWLHREDFTSRFITIGTSVSDSVTLLASTDWEAAITALHAGELPSSSGERRMLLLAASIAGGIPVSLYDTLPGIDRSNASLVVGAVAHAAGLADQETDKRYLNG
jgi:integrase